MSNKRFNDTISEFAKCRDKPEELVREWRKKYQPELTTRLDSYQDEIDQNWLNLAMLWKVNRYAHLEQNVIDALNSINPSSTIVPSLETVTEILNQLMNIKGVKLAMASTILRFRNPNIYQIIDQRSYRVVTGKELNLKDKSVSIGQLYFTYLEQVRALAAQHGFEFKDADRILYMADIKLKNPKLKNFGSAS